MMMKIKYIVPKHNTHKPFPNKENKINSKQESISDESFIKELKH